MLPNVGMGELILILAIVLLVFGAKRVPDIAKSLGRSIKAFKEGMTEPDPDSDKKDNNKEG